MKKVLHPADSRGKGEYGWLSTRYSFSFAEWHDPARMGFGALRVINDDTVAPKSGFGMHPHRDMEIITLVMSGTLSHKDTMENVGMIGAGDIQAMSAGTGIVHAEFNDSPDTPVTLFQIWIEPNVAGAAPRYSQKEAAFSDPLSPGITALVSPDGAGDTLPIYQDAYISRLVIDEEHPYTYAVRGKNHGLYALVMEGSAQAADELLDKRDALGVWETGEITFRATGTTTLLLIEVPMR